MNDDISTYLAGEKLYGDDFTSEQIEKWFADEAEGYANLGAKERDRYHYTYHCLNREHGFKFIGQRKIDEALGIGSAYGDEFHPIADKINNIVILDPSDAFATVNEIAGTPCRYVKPSSGGGMPFRSGQFDLVTSLGVLHHIPNVSYVLSECHRCLSPGGIMLVREPIVSMGDWRRPRKGLTKRERGIPLKVMRDIIENTGFSIQQESLCIFPVLPRLANQLGIAAYNSYTITLLDTMLSRLFSWNIKYHRTRIHEKFAPSSVFFVLQK